MGLGVPCQLPLRRDGDELSHVAAPPVASAELLVPRGRGAVLHRVSHCLPAGGAIHDPDLVPPPTRGPAGHHDRRLVCAFDRHDGVQPLGGLLLTLHTRLGARIGRDPRRCQRQPEAASATGRGRSHLAGARCDPGVGFHLLVDHLLSGIAGGRPGARIGSRHCGRDGTTGPWGGARPTSSGIPAARARFLLPLSVALADPDDRAHSATGRPPCRRERTSCW